MRDLFTKYIKNIFQTIIKTKSNDKIHNLN